MIRHLGIALLAIFGAIMVSLLIGRYGFSFHDLLSLSKALLAGQELTIKQHEILLVLIKIRLPRIVAAILVGAGLAVSGGAYQAMFLNPLVSPGILGVLSGASFGAALGIVFFRSIIMTQVLAFCMGCAAVGLAILLSTLVRRSSLLVMLLGGMISAALFGSLTSLLKFLADPNKELPELVYWLMGSFARVNEETLVWIGLPIIGLIIYLSAQGKVANVLSMGDEEALSLGVAVKRTRLQIILAATLLSALTVILTGIIQWVGLVIPHIMRFAVGPDNRVLLPASAIGGAVFMLGTDAVVRSVSTAELPIGVFTSLVALPLFILSLYVNRRNWR